MQRYQVLVSGFCPQAVQQTFIDIAAPRNNGKEVGFAGYQQVVILKNDCFAERDLPFQFNFPEIVQGLVREVLCL
jgi:hypothetical protein